jgi:hypothetical protein
VIKVYFNQSTALENKVGIRQCRPKCRPINLPVGMCGSGYRYPVKFRHPALSGIRYKFAGYLLDSTVRYFITTMKRKSTWRLQIVKHEQLLSVCCITTYFFRDGDVNCSFANSSKFYILNTNKQCKVNHKIWPW